jgi:hypothetical protein
MIDYNATSQEIDVAGQLLKEEWTNGSYPNVNYMQVWIPAVANEDPAYQENKNKSPILLATFTARINLMPTREVMQAYGLDWQEGTALVMVPTYILQHTYAQVTSTSYATLFSLLHNDDYLEFSTILDIDNAPKQFRILQITQNGWLGGANLMTVFACTDKPAKAR